MSVRNMPRLYVDVPRETPLGSGEVLLPRAQTHYLVNVMRRKQGDSVLVFNGHDGEWRCVIEQVKRSDMVVRPLEVTRSSATPADLQLLFAPLKKARTDFIAQKATEMGVSRITPVITERTIAERVKTDRLAANAIEAAEQCGLLWVPDIEEPTDLSNVIAAWPADRILIFCDEGAAASSPIHLLTELPNGPKSILIGPEGGFSSAEASALRALPHTIVISLGPRIMRADTAAIAALTLVQATCGDWRR